MAIKSKYKSKYMKTTGKSKKQHKTQIKKQNANKFAGGSFKDFIYRNLGKNKTVRMPLSVQLFKNVMKKTSSKPKFFSIVYNYRIATEQIDVDNFVNKVISHQNVMQEPKINIYLGLRYLLIMYDADNINYKQKNGQKRPLLHWAIEIKNHTKTGLSIITYKPPSPVTGIHNYKFQLFLYPEQLQYKTANNDPVDREKAYTELYTFINTNKLEIKGLKIMKIKKQGLSASNQFNRFVRYVQK
jgi:hypothetical protein